MWWAGVGEKEVGLLCLVRGRRPGSRQLRSDPRRTLEIQNKHLTLDAVEQDRESA